MRNLLLTTALVVPLAAGPLLAQGTQQLPADDQTEAQAEAGAAETAPETGDDAFAADAPGAADDPALADDAAVAEDEAPAEAPAGVVTEQQPSELRGDWIIGTTVMSTQDETIGSIQDLIIDEEEGRITAAVLSVGGFLGFGAKNIAVDWNELQIDYDGRDITLAITREEADAAPEYEFRDQAELPPPPDAGIGAPDPGAAPMPGADPGAPGAPVD